MYSNRNFSLVAQGVTTTFTATASDQVGTATNPSYMPKFPMARQISAIRVQVTATPIVSSPQLVFLNGTSTVGVVAVGTATAGETADATITKANANLAEGDQLDLEVISTATASADQVAGVYNIWFSEE